MKGKRLEMDPSMAGLPVIDGFELLVGTMSAQGQVPEDIPLPIDGQAQAGPGVRAGLGTIADVQGVLRR